MATKHAPVVLIVRDGWGTNPHTSMDQYNAILQANTPVADSLFQKYPSTHIGTSGENVGLPSEIMGNSEVGHQNIGAGRIVPQELMRLNNSVADNEFQSNYVIQQAFDRGCHQHATHIIGLVSDGCVHSDIAHLYALIDTAPKDCKVFLHVITDGRDCSPTAGISFVQSLEERIRHTNIKIATVMGRYWAMDRDHRWERVALAYQVMTGRQTSHRLDLDMPNIRTAKQASKVISDYYNNPSEPSRSGDEFIVPTQLIDANNQPVGVVQNGDAILFFNYRGDRPRELTKSFVLDDESWLQMPREPFSRGKQFSDLFFATMTNYESNLPVSAVVFEKPAPMKNILGDVLAQQGLHQFRCAETEKFPHVTFFFNDYRETPFDGETRFLVPSPTDVTTYDKKPEMSADAVCQGVLEQLKSNECPDVIIVNFANGDMVGHTGILPAIIKAVEVVDTCCGNIIEATLSIGGSLIVTADHGNAERTWNEELNCPDTAHTTYDVPLHVISNAMDHCSLRDNGILADIAPTLLHMLDIQIPQEMTGKSLLM